MTKLLPRILAGCCVVLLAACAEPPLPPLRIGVSPWVGGDPLVFAGAERLVKRDIARVVELGSSSESLRGLRNGVLDGAALTLDEALRLADEGIELKIVAVLNESHGGDAVLAKPPLSRPDQLRGAYIAAEQSAVGGLMLARLLEAGGLRPADVGMVRVEAIDHQEVFDGARVDAVITYEPIKTRLQNAGYRVIFDSAAIPGQIVDVLVMTSDAVARRPNDVAHIVAGWERGLETFEESIESVAELMAPGAGLNALDYRAALEGLRFVSVDDSVRMLSGQPAGLARAASALESFLVGNGFLSGPPDWDNLIDPRSAERAAAKRQGVK